MQKETEHIMLPKSESLPVGQPEEGGRKMEVTPGAVIARHFAESQYLRFFACCLVVLVYAAKPQIFIENILTFSLTLFGVQMLDFVWNLGRKIRPLDIMAILATVAYLLSPALSYYVVEIDWYEGFNFMATPAERYFPVALPATLALIAGLNFPFKATQIDHKTRIEEIEAHLAKNVDTGIKVFWAGVACTVVSPFAPSGIAHFLVIGSHLIYVGGLYIWFSNHEGRMPYFIAMWVLPILKSIRYSMFGEMIFWSIFLIMILLMKYPIKFYVKLLFAAGGVLLLLFVQSIKYEFRLNTWQNYDVGLSQRVEIFKQLSSDRVNNPELLYGQAILTGALDRSNQGSLTSMAIRYVPEYEPFAKGETIFVALAASFIPRFIWPDKPTVDGHENMRRFTGFQPFEGTAMDIGQVGDAYVNFGIWGGALFLLFYGMFYGFVNAKLFQMSAFSSPAALLWIPLFFAGCIQVESSVLSTVNHLIKVAMFYFIAQWGFKKFFDARI